jgi:hypothetical protein
MKTSEFAKILEAVVRKVVREELKPIITEMKTHNKKSIKQNVVAETFDPLDVSHVLDTPKKKAPTFTNNNVLNEILSETYNSGEWKNINDTVYNSQSAKGFNRNAMAEMLGYGQATNIVPTVDPEGNPMNADIAGTAVEKALTRDYSQLMKAINDKKKK